MGSSEFTFDFLLECWLVRRKWCQNTDVTYFQLHIFASTLPASLFWDLPFIRTSWKQDPWTLDTSAFAYLSQSLVSNPQFDITHLYMSSLVHFSGRRSSQHPGCPARNNSHFDLENDGWKMSLVFLVWHPPWFFSFSGMVWRLPIYRMYQHKNSVKQAGTSHWNK